MSTRIATLTIVGSILGLLIVRGLLLDPLEELAFRMFFDRIGDGGAFSLGRVLGSATFIKCALGMFLGGVAGALVARLGPSTGVTTRSDLPPD